MRIAIDEFHRISTATLIQCAFGAIKFIAKQSFIDWPARGIIMLIFVKRVPLAIRSDIVVACLRACVWARVEGRPFCLLTR